MRLVSLQTIFINPQKLNEIDLINHVHRLREQSKKWGLTGVMTYRAELFALHIEGQQSGVEKFTNFLSERYSIKVAESTYVLSRKYTGLNLSYVGNDAPIVNEPVLDWGIENPSVVFPEELTRKILELNKTGLK